MISNVQTFTLFHVQTRDDDRQRLEKVLSALAGEGIRHELVNSYVRGCAAIKVADHLASRAAKVLDKFPIPAPLTAETARVSALTSKQRRIAEALRSRRPPVFEGSNVIADAASRDAYNGEVTAAMRRWAVSGSAAINEFCDLAGVPN